MSKITLKDLSHSYLDKQSSNDDWALRNINIVEDFDFYEFKVSVKSSDVFLSIEADFISF